MQKRMFDTPKRPPKTTVKIQYDARVPDVEKIAEYLGRPSMGAADIGRHTFQYFLRNEVGDE